MESKKSAKNHTAIEQAPCTLIEQNPIVDNAAVDKADISVGAIHEETPDNLIWDYFVKFEDVTAFLRGLLKNNFRFNLRLPDRSFLFSLSFLWLNKRGEIRKCVY